MPAQTSQNRYTPASIRNAAVTRAAPIVIGMDALAVILGIATFAILLFLVGGIDRI